MLPVGHFYPRHALLKPSGKGATRHANYMSNSIIQLEPSTPSVMCIACRRIVRVPADAAAGSQHVIGILPNDVDVHDAKENADSLLLRLLDKSEVTHTALLYPSV